MAPKIKIIDTESILFRGEPAERYRALGAAMDGVRGQLSEIAALRDALVADMVEKEGGRGAQSRVAEILGIHRNTVSTHVNRHRERSLVDRWDRVVDLTPAWDDSLGFEEKRDLIAYQVHHSGWEGSHVGKLADLIDRVSSSETEEELESAMGALERHARSCNVKIAYKPDDLPRISAAQALTWIGKRVTVVTKAGASHTGQLTQVGGYTPTLCLVWRGGSAEVSMEVVESISPATD